MASQKQATQSHLVQEKFDARASDYTSWYEGLTLSAHAFRRRLQLAAEIIRQEPRGKVLDIGCGPGVLVRDLLCMGNEIWGVDVAPEMIKRCESQFGAEEKAHFSAGKIERLDFPTEMFDAAVCLGVVEYLDDDDAALAELSRVLKPGGLAVISCPHYWAPWRRWDAFYWSVVQPIRNLLGRPPYSQVVHREYRESAYRKLLETHGFEVVDVCYYGFGMIPTPFDRKFPKLHYSLGCVLDSQTRGLLRKLGMGFIISARKRTLELVQ